MSLKEAIAQARERQQQKETLEDWRGAIWREFGEDFARWFEPAYVIGSDDVPEARFTHNGVQLALWQDGEGWGVTTGGGDVVRLSGKWEDADEANDELLVLIGDLAPEQSAAE